jgi:DNA polymerase I-like protein with 3'-5' exonuclease and polymerase domains
MKLVSIDIETWGAKEGYTLQPWQMRCDKSGILCIGISDGTETKVHLEPEWGLFEDKLIDLYQNKNIVICGWNLQFDLSYLLQKFPVLFKFNFLDGKLLLKRIKQDLPSYGLKKTLLDYKDFLGKDFVSDYSKAIEFKVGRSWDSYSAQEQLDMIEYNARDALYTHQLITHLLTIASYKDKLQAVRESTIAAAFALAWTNGIELDTSVIADYEINLESGLQKIDALLGKIGITNKIANSPKQLADFLMHKAGIELTELTEKGVTSTNQNVLKNLVYKHSDHRKAILNLLLKRKSLETELTKFVKSAKDCAELYDNKAYPEPFLNSTYTGRVTYGIYHNIKTKKIFKNKSERFVNKKIHIGVPIHQMKRGEIRNLLIAPNGHDIVEFDFAAQEVRLIACLANEQTMIELFNNNMDLHSYTAAGIAGMEYNEFLELQKTDPDKFKEIRFLGKLTNLSLQYRLGATSLYRQWHDKYGIRNKTQDDATFARETYKRLYLGIPRYWENAITRAKSLGYTENLAGRKYFLDDWSESNSWKSEQTAINFPVQSSGAEQKVLGLYELKKNILNKDSGIKFAWDLHDGLYFYIPECAMQYEIIVQMAEILSNLPYTKAWGWTPKVKFPVEVKIGKRWGELKSLKIGEK